MVDTTKVFIEEGWCAPDATKIPVPYGVFWGPWVNEKKGLVTINYFDGNRQFFTWDEGLIEKLNRSLLPQIDGLGNSSDYTFNLAHLLLAFDAIRFSDKISPVRIIKSGSSESEFGQVYFGQHPLNHTQKDGLVYVTDRYKKIKNVFQNYGGESFLKLNTPL